MKLEPETSERVLHQVLHNPMRREKLGHRRNVLRARLDVLLEAFFDLALLLGDVELVEPADHLDIGTDFGRERGANLGKDRRGGEQIVGKQHFGFITELLEEKRHLRVPGVASRHEKRPISRRVRIVLAHRSAQDVANAILHPGTEKTVVKIPVASLGEDPGYRTTHGRGDNARIGITVHVHEP